MQRPDWDTYFMLQAEIAKLRSNCLSRHIGAVIVKDNRQIATGYNGTPAGIKNCFDGGCPRCTARMNGEIKPGESLDRCLCTHAEANAIMQCALFGNAGSTRGATLYTTLAPCIECSKMAISVGITRIVVMADYPEDGTNLLGEAKIELTKLDSESLRPWTSRMMGDPKSVS
ncbi:MAG TPA: dCMP deaminase family protein [Nitrososphaeraceae archaeon]|nr:dCMP deaminase family protein [Nitrososphaeraceae archaeon]